MPDQKKPEQLIDPKKASPDEVMLWQQHLLIQPGCHFWTDATEEDLQKCQKKLHELGRRAFTVGDFLADPQLGVPGMPLFVRKVTRTQ